MSDCCSAPLVEDRSKICPECGKKGKKVRLITMQNLVRPERAPEIKSGQYYYCPTHNCETVYFSPSTRSFFRKADLTVRVGAKETSDPIPVCYCFGHTEASIRQEIEALGRSSVDNKIRAEIKAGNCACEINNPAGTCCLGDVRAAVKRLLEKHDEISLPSNQMRISLPR